MGTDCKSVGLCLRRFESCTCHRVCTQQMSAVRAVRSAMIYVDAPAAVCDRTHVVNEVRMICSREHGGAA